MSKKNLYIGLISVASLAHIFYYPFLDGDMADQIFAIFGSFIPVILISFLVSKYANRDADKEEKLKNFTIAFCLMVILMMFGNIK